MGKHTGLVTRLAFRTFTLAGVVGVLALVSWAIASNSLGDLLGAPPPNMGRQSTTFLWNGVPALRGRPMAWRFSFQGTVIPGAPNVRVYVSPLGRVIWTEPGDLAARVKALRRGFI